ncbi:EAL domain-containing protein [Lacticaseibacillus porcinae]|uniref:EAL domain-containing protein n=1 Tax=Lacticaseibacillus porcinae TaxID=1123687 RepID=UPI000F78961E|nr:EAL domain-containing protein [Lacticaseibacillus porcinae]
MLRLWGQPKYVAATGKLAGYELFLREKQTTDGEWELPADFSQFSPNTMANLIGATLKTLPQDFQLVSFNLDQAQFIDTKYIDLLVAVQAQLDYALVIELTERRGHGSATIALSDLVAAAQRFQEAGLRVCLDDVGTGENQLPLVEALDPFVSEYKFALQNVRDQMSIAEIAAEVAVWRKRADRLHKRFALEGFEDPEDVRLIQAFSPDLVQGFYFGRPHTLPIAEDFKTLP